MVAIAGKEIATPDAVIMGAGVVGVINLFIPWYKLTASDVDDLGEARKAAKFFGDGNLNADSITTNAFSSGFLALLPAIMVLVVAGLVAARIFAGFATPSAGKVGPMLLLTGLAAGAVVLLVLKFLFDHSWVSFGFFLALIIAVVQTAMLYPAFKASGERIPEIGGRDFNPGGGTPPPPPPSA